MSKSFISTRAINNLIKLASVFSFWDWIAYSLLIALLFGLVLHALRKRFWLLPSAYRIFALNAGTLALLGFAAKVAKPGDQQECDLNIVAKPGFYVRISPKYHMLICNVLICVVVGALMPSIAASTDIRDMWSNVLGIGFLIVSTNFFIFLQMFYEPPDCSRLGVTVTTITATAGVHAVVMASQFLLLLVLLVQTTALGEIISDMKGTVFEQLEQLCMDAKPGCKDNDIVQRPAWSWEVVERNTRIKLMMVLTSSPQNVMTRSPCVAIVGTVVLCCFIAVTRLMAPTVTYVFTHPRYINILHFWLDQIDWFIILGFGLISMWRWVRVAVQEERSFSYLLSNAEPSYWRRKVINFQRRMLTAGPYVCKKGQYAGFKEVVHHTAFSVLCSFHWLLVAVIKLVHIFSVLLIQKLFCLPLKSLGCGIFILSKRLFKIKTQAAEFSTNDVEFLGVVCLEDEDAGTVHREFAGAHNLIIQTQLKKATDKAHLKDLIILLKGIKNPSSLLQQSNGILDVLRQDGAPDVENLCVEHGYQYGWGLTMVALLNIMTEIEVKALGTSTLSDAAMNACWQAMEMMQVVDEQFVPCSVCSKETYAKAFTSEWYELAEKKKWRWSQKRNQVTPQLKPDEVLMRLLEPVERHLEDFNIKARSSACGYDIAAATWSQRTVVSYTMHTVCQNLSRLWIDLESAPTANRLAGEEEESNARVEAMVEYINALLAEVLACCLLNLSTALDMSTREAVLSGSLSKIKKGLLLLGLGKRLWEELEWPATLHSPKNTGFGQLRQWFH